MVIPSLIGLLNLNAENADVFVARRTLYGHHARGTSGITLNFAEWATLTPPGTGSIVNLPSNPYLGCQPVRLEIVANGATGGSGANKYTVKTTDGNTITVNESAIAGTTGVPLNNLGSVTEFHWDAAAVTWRMVTLNPGVGTYQTITTPPVSGTAYQNTTSRPMFLLGDLHHHHRGGDGVGGPVARQRDLHHHRHRDPRGDRRRLPNVRHGPARLVLQVHLHQRHGRHLDRGRIGVTCRGRCRPVPSPGVALDAFPFDVCVGDTVHREARIVEHAGRVLIFVSVDGKPVKVAEAELVGEIPDGRRVVRELNTVDGVWTVDSSPGCGCRNVLKRATKPLLMDLIEPGAEHVTRAGR